MQKQTTQTLSGQGPAERGEQRPGHEWPMHARGVGEMLDLALELFVACIVPTVGLAFLMWLPVRCIWVLLEQRGANIEALRAIFNAFAGSLVHLMTVSLIIQVVYGELQGRRPSLREPLIVALKRAPALFLATLVISLGTSIGMICMAVPGIVLMYVWSVAPAALVLERKGPLECLRRSYQLVNNRFLAWAGITVCVYALKAPYDAVAVCLDLPQVMNWAKDEIGVSPLVYSLAQVFLSALLLAISSAAYAIAITVFYLDCRVRREGFDLAMRLERAESASVSGPRL